MHGSPINMVIDSGIAVEILDTEDFKQLKEKPVLQPTKCKNLSLPVTSASQHSRGIFWYRYVMWKFK